MQTFTRPSRNLSIISMFVVMIGMALWPNSLINAKSLTSQATMITITQWIDWPTNSGAKQSSQTPYHTLWYVDINVTTLNGGELHDTGGGSLSFSYDGQMLVGTFPNPGGPLILAMSSEGIGNHLIQAIYTGDSAFAASSSQATHTITKADAGLAIDGSSTFGYDPGELLKLRVISNLGIPMGEALKFFINGSLVYVYTIPAPGVSPFYFININGVAPVPLKAPSIAGKYILSVVYGGDPNILAGSSPNYQISVKATVTPTPLPAATEAVPPVTPTPAPGTPITTPFPNKVSASSPIPTSSPPTKQSGTPWWWLLIVLGVGSVVGLGVAWRTKSKRSK